MKLKRWVALCASLLLIATVFVGCKSGVANIDSLPQFSELTDGEEIAIMTVKDYGEIKLRFFPEESPKAVENFITHAKNGYYDGVTFHRVMKDFMIQGGDPKGDGTGGESIWGTGFGPEPSEKLYHFRGALCMAQSSLPNSIGSQFYIVQNSVTDQMEEMLEYSQIEYADIVKKQYQEVGGYPPLDGSYTVFGQVFEGLDVVDEIASCAVVYNTRGERSVPVNDVVIEKIQIIAYQK